MNVSDGGLVVVDPGTTTGVCVVEGDWAAVKGKRAEALEFLREGLRMGSVWTYELDARTLGLDGVAHELADECERVNASVTVHEDFILREATMDRRLLDPVRITQGFVSVWTDRHFGGWRGLKFVKQQPSSMKSKFGGPKKDGGLASAGLWIVGSSHMRDAMGHAALWMVRTKWTDA